MNVLSQLYYSTKEKFSGRNGFDELEAECFAEYMEGLKQENKDLKLELKNYKNDYLTTENQLLKEKLYKIENLYSEAMQENYFLSDKNEELEKENARMENKINNLKDEIDCYEDSNKGEHLSWEEMNEDYYTTKDLDNKQCADAIDELTDERETYKEVINVMCDKYNIEHDEVFNIIDDIQSGKDNQLEKEFI